MLDLNAIGRAAKDLNLINEIKNLNLLRFNFPSKSARTFRTTQYKGRRMARRSAIDVIDSESVDPDSISSAFCIRDFSWFAVWIRRLNCVDLLECLQTLKVEFHYWIQKYERAFASEEILRLINTHGTMTPYKESEIHMRK